MPVIREVSALEIARRRRGLSQRELAEQANVSRETISLTERGVQPTARTAEAVADVLGVSIDVLFPRER